MKRIRIIKNCIVTVGILISATLLGWCFNLLGFPEPNVVVVYILAVLFTARLTEGYYFGLLASVISILSFNYFFTAPYYTFDVYDPSYFVTFAIMTITSVVTSTLTSKAKLYTKKVEEKEAESQVLYSLTNQLSDAAEIEQIISISLRNICALLSLDAGFIYFKSHDEVIFLQQTDGKQIHRTTDQIRNLWEAVRSLRTEYALKNGYMHFPIRGNERLLGALRIAQEQGILLNTEKRRLLHSMLENVAIALERTIVMQERIKDREAMVRERYRANLLRAISHDLRTPLTGIMGTAEMLMDMTEQSDRRFAMMQGIYQDADWLHSLVENILSLTRLKDGKMEVKKEPQALEEVIEAAVSHMEKLHPGREIAVSLPEEFHLVPMDARLIEQVIINLLDNAVKHTLLQQKISILVDYQCEKAIVSVQDEGEGISPKDEANIFQMFYTTQSGVADAKKGVGLGLAICETVIKAHGGKITGGNRKDRTGALFTFELPL